MTSTTPKPRAGEHSAMCIWDDCGSDAIYCEGHAREYMLPDIDTRVRDLLDTLEELVTRCDGEEGVRSDGSNIQTMRASALLAKHGR